MLYPLKGRFAHQLRPNGLEAIAAGAPFLRERTRRTFCSPSRRQKSTEQVLDPWSRQDIESIRRELRRLRCYLGARQSRDAGHVVEHLMRYCRGYRVYRVSATDQIVIRIATAVVSVIFRQPDPFCSKHVGESGGREFAYATGSETSLSSSS